MLVVACLKSNVPELESPPIRMDLLYHIGAYSVLGFFWVFFRISWKLWFVLFFIQGLIIEVIQPSFGRHFEWIDLVFNSLGLLIGILVVKLLKVKKS